MIILNIVITIIGLLSSFIVYEALDKLGNNKKKYIIFTIFSILYILLIAITTQEKTLTLIAMT